MVTTPVQLGDYRWRVLRELGVTPYGLRGRFNPDRHAPGATDARRDAAVSPACVLVLPKRCAGRQRALIERIMQALGPGFAQAQYLTVAGGELAMAPPVADAYLAFGEAQAQALDQGLPTAARATVEVVVLDPPEALFQAAGKRRLWQSVRALCRRRRAVPGPAE